MKLLESGTLLDGFLVDHEPPIQIKTELSIVERHGIGRALSRRGPGGVVVHQDLAVRVAALVSFWLSEEYAQARGAVAPTPG